MCRWREEPLCGVLFSENTSTILGTVQSPLELQEVRRRIFRSTGAPPRKYIHAYIKAMNVFFVLQVHLRNKSKYSNGLGPRPLQYALGGPKAIVM